MRCLLNSAVAPFGVAQTFELQSLWESSSWNAFESDSTHTPSTRLSRYPYDMRDMRDLPGATGASVGREEQYVVENSTQCTDASISLTNAFQL